MPTHPDRIIGVHLDLKYLMPRKEYLQQWLREIAAQGINTLLLEYEDKFPFEKYSFLRAEDAFTPDELQSFLSTARQCGLRVVPLVQTLSHLEFALAHEELAHLREAPDVLTQINPSNPDALAFVNDLIDEILAYHQEDEYFHLGADETWFVGTDPSYAPEVETMGLPAYWARHLRPYIEQVVKAGKRPMVWDDVFWNEPHIIESVDLSKEVILVSWEYIAHTPEVLSRVDVYQAAGFDVLGAPCLNMGVLVPMHDHALKNTTAWAQKVKQSQLLGLLNTSWSVFHTPLSTQMPYIAATAALLNGEDDCDAAWEEQWAQAFFGVEGADFFNALRDLSLDWEQKIEGLGRPITPVVYGYMDLVLHYRSQQKRMKCGSYPLDWNEMDLPGIYQQKINLLRGLHDQQQLADKLDELGSAYDRATSFFQDFPQRVQDHREEARLLSCFAGMKALHVRLLQYLLFGLGDSGGLRRALDQQKPLLENCLAPFYEPAGVARLMKLWWEPAASVMMATVAQP